MNIHFDRFRTQEKIEQLLGCYNLENWKDYKFALSTFSTDDTNKDLLLDYLKEDTKDTGSIKWKMYKNIGLPFIRRISF